jgi:hypothetical protein
MQIMLPKSLTSAAAEVAEVISDTELKIKKEFSAEGAKITDKIREATETEGLEIRKLPFIDQADMYRHVYDSLNRGGSIGIFPEGSFSSGGFLVGFFTFEFRRQSRPNGPSSTKGWRIDYGPGSDGQRPQASRQSRSGRIVLLPCA